MDPTIHTATPVTLVIFGASGDLTQRKLAPALFSQHRKGRLPANTRIVGFARRPYSHDEFRAQLRSGAQQFASQDFDAAAWDAFAACLLYSPGNFDAPADYDRLQTCLSQVEGGPARAAQHFGKSDLPLPANTAMKEESRIVHLCEYRWKIFH